MARDRGDGATSKAFDPGWDSWAVIDQSLDRVWTDMGVPPLGPANAADGVCPDWCDPSAG